LIAAISPAGWQSAAAAGASIDWSGCDAAKRYEAIAACSHLIQSGKLKPNDLSRAYFNRGLAEKSRANSTKPPLLLGQPFLQNFKSWSIDNLKHKLLLEPAN
jgi:hypothetical protein